MNRLAQDGLSLKKWGRVKKGVANAKCNRVENMKCMEAVCAQVVSGICWFVEKFIMDFILCI